MTEELWPPSQGFGPQADLAVLYSVLQKGAAGDSPACDREEFLPPHVGQCGR